MRLAVRGVAGLLGTALLAVGVPACSQPEPAFVEVAKDDARMNAAIAEAKGSLPQFWDRFKAGGPDYSDFMVKAGMPAAAGDGVEHIWIDLDAYADGRVKGRLANDPLYLGDELKYGSPVEFAEDIVSDWGYAKGEITYGHFTTRVLMASQEPDATLADYGLSPTPIEAETN